MTTVVPLEYEGLKEFQIEISTSQGYVRQGGVEDATKKAQQQFQACVDGVRRLAEGFVSAFSAAAAGVQPAEIELKVGIKAGGESNWIIASGSAEANFEVTVVWKPRRDANA